MKKSELRNLIREEILKESNQKTLAKIKSYEFIAYNDMLEIDWTGNDGDFVIYEKDLDNFMKAMNTAYKKFKKMKG